jgi:DNA polymerase-3 subunit gamma/tau
MLSTAAFNAFLKTLEEPPQHAIFILATTEKQKIIPTILSRCQIFDFKRISPKDAQDYLKVIADREGVDAEDKALHLIAQKADGAMRDALSIFDRMISYAGEKLTAKHVSLNLNILDYDSYLDITELLHNGDLHNSILRFNQLLALGFDGYHFINGLSKHFRDLMMCQNEGTTQLLEVDAETETAFMTQAKQVSKAFLLDALDLTNKYALQYKNSLHPHLQVELCLMQVASLNEGEKKNSKPYIKAFDGIVPKKTLQKEVESSSTQTENLTETVLTPTAEVVIEPSETAENTAERADEKNQQIEKPLEVPEKEEVIQLDLSSQGVSGLSLSSLKVQKEHKNKVVSASEDKEVRESEVNQESIEQHWKKFSEIIAVNGEKNMVALLQLDIPRLKNKTEIHYAVPNDTNRVELEKNSNELMTYLRDQLSNDALTLKVHLEVKEEKKFVYTNQDKYHALAEKNPALELFKKKFNLEY